MSLQLQAGRCCCMGMTVWPQTLCTADDVAPVVLVVEDEVLVRLAAAQHLRDTGYEVMEARNADEALRLLANADVDVVFSDITMPGIRDGLQLVDWLREHRPGVGTVLTGKLHPEGRYGQFLGKPYRLADLDLCLVEILQRRRAKHALPKRQLAALPAG
jgi:CheY-like chemotaxis protein